MNESVAQLTARLRAASQVCMVAENTDVVDEDEEVEVDEEVCSDGDD